MTEPEHPAGDDDELGLEEYIEILSGDFAWE
jgi:hypothetical protein